MEKVILQLLQYDAASWAISIILVAAIIALIRNLLLIIFQLSDRFKPKDRPCEYLLKLTEQVATTNVAVASELASLKKSVEFIEGELHNGMGFARKSNIERKKKNE